MLHTRARDCWARAFTVSHWYLAHVQFYGITTDNSLSIEAAERRGPQLQCAPRKQNRKQPVPGQTKGPIAPRKRAIGFDLKPPNGMLASHAESAAQRHHGSQATTLLKLKDTPEHNK